MKDGRVIQRLLLTALVLGPISYAAAHHARGQMTSQSLPDPITLGGSPGSTAPSEFAPPGAEIIGGKRRGGGIPRKAARTPRMASSATLVGTTVMQVPSARITTAGVSPPSPGALPDDKEDEGPADGLTLDAA